MNKSLTVVIMVLALLAAGVWFFTSSSSMLPAPSPAASSTSPSVSPTALPATKAAAKNTGVPNSTTYKSLLTQTGSYECDYNSVQANGRTSNVVYIYGGKMRGEFRTGSAGDSSGNLFVYDGHYLYQWKEGASVGTRTVLSSLSQLPLIIPKDLTSGSIIGDNYSSVGWLCHTWLTNKALLTPPSYVTFS